MWNTPIYGRFNIILIQLINESFPSWGVGGAPARHWHRWSGLSLLFTPAVLCSLHQDTLKNLFVPRDAPVDSFPARLKQLAHKSNKLKPFESLVPVEQRAWGVHCRGPDASHQGVAGPTGNALLMQGN